MKLGFYYHIPVFVSEKGVMLPAYLGVFIEELAKRFTTLTLLMHEASESERQYCEYLITESNVQLISLGRKTAAWDRFLCPNKTLNVINEFAQELDVILVRAPSPLAPSFYKLYREKTKVCYLVVGDYFEGSKHIKQPWWRIIPIIVLNVRNDFQLTRALKGALTLVNSSALFERYHNKVSNLFEIRTTTLSENDFFLRNETCTGREIKLLYTGRIDLAKGLRELIEATAILIKEQINVSLHLAAWEDDTKKPIEKLLKELADSLQVKDKIIFHGRKKLGNELNKMYRMADIYVIPSYHEGFPRTIWEAMANGLPVIATKVGSIPAFVGDSAELIEPKSSMAIVKAVKNLLGNKSRVKTIIKEGYKLALENTLENRVREMSEIIKLQLSNE